MPKSSGTAVRLLLLILAALVLFALVAYYQRTQGAERFNQSLTPQTQAASVLPSPTMDAGVISGAAPFSPAPPRGSKGGSGSSAAASYSAIETMSNEDLLPVYGQGGSTLGDSYPQDRLSAEDLLPKDAANSKWAQMNPAGQGDVQNQNLLTAGYHLGVDTQGSSLRNASHDLRSTPPAPRYRVSIWNQSDIDPDMHRRPLE